MRKIVSPIDGIKSPLGQKSIAAVTLLQSETQGMALDFITNTSAVRTQS